MIINQTNSNSVIMPTYSFLTHSKPTIISVTNQKNVIVILTSVFLWWLILRFQFEVKLTLCFRYVMLYQKTHLELKMMMICWFFSHNQRFVALTSLFYCHSRKDQRTHETEEGGHALLWRIADFFSPLMLMSCPDWMKNWLPSASQLLAPLVGLSEADSGGCSSHRHIRNRRKDVLLLLRLHRCP